MMDSTLNTPQQDTPLPLLNLSLAPSPLNPLIRQNSCESYEEEQKDQINTLIPALAEYSPGRSHRALSVLHQPIIRRFSIVKSPSRLPFLSPEIPLPNTLEQPLQHRNYPHSRRSIIHNLEDFLSDFSAKQIENQNLDPEDLELRKKNDREMLYDYMQFYMKMDMDELREENENNPGIEEDEEKEKLIRELNDIPALYRQKYKAGSMRECAFLQVAKMNEIEKLKVDYTLYPDNLPLLWLRRSFLLLCKRISFFAKTIVQSVAFQIFSVLMILINSLTYSLISNRSNQYESYSSLIHLAHTFFLFIYVVEMGLKILAFGIFIHHNSYFRDGWNWLDFVVILFLIVTYADIKSIDISLVRLLRLLKPVRDNLAFGHFQILISALFSALPLLLVAFAILMFFYLFYAIAGLQIFSGILKQRCFHNLTGKLMDPDFLCGNLPCEDGFFCGKGLENPYLNVINFDNIFSAVMQTLLIVTLDNWTTIMYSIQKVFSNFAWVYFVSLVIVGNYFLISLTLAVIKVKFSETHKHMTESLFRQRKTMKGRTYIELAELKKEGTWDARKIQKKLKSEANHEGNKATFYIFKFFKFIRTCLFTSYRSASVKKPAKLKNPEHEFIEKQNSMLKSKIFEIGTKLLKFFYVGKKTLVRVRSNRIDEDTDPHYLKIRVNHQFFYESSSKYDVLEDLTVKEMMLNKKRRSIRRHFQITELQLKKNDNYFVDFLSYITKKKKVKIRTMKRSQLINSFVKKRNESTGIPFSSGVATSRAEDILGDIEQKKSFSEYVETDFPGSPRKCARKQKKSIAVLASSRMEEANFQKKNMMAQIEQDEAFVLSYKRNSARGSTRSFGKMSQSQLSLMHASKIRDSSPNYNLHIFAKLRNNRSFKSTDAEYVYLKEFISAPIEVDDHLERNKAAAGEMQIKEKYDIVMVKTLIYFPTRVSDIKTKFVWSGQDILGNYNLDHMEKIIESLNIHELDRFLEEANFRFMVLRDKVRIILDSFLTENLMLYTVLCYIILMASEGVILDEDYDHLDLSFTIIFTIEIFLKFLAYGLRAFLSNYINQMDLFILFLSYIQLVLTSSASDMVKYVRFLTAFKVLRILRLSQKSKFLKFIVSIIMQTISSFIYLFMLLILFNFVYALIGMQLFGGTFPKSDYIKNNFSFDTFWISFLTVFDIITLDNWIDILALGFNSHQGSFETAFFIISWIFLGYFVLLNLFLAILLDGFAEKLNEKDARELQSADLEDRHSKEPNDFKFIVDREAGEVILDELSKFKGENAKEFAQNINIDRYQRKVSIQSPNRRKNSYRSKTQIKSFENIFCLNSFYIFSKDNNLRVMFYRVISHKRFDDFMIVVLCFSSLLLIFDTYLDSDSISETERLFKTLSKAANAGLCFVFFLEVVLKSISYGFILDKRSYMRNPWNVLDFLLSICYVVDILTDDTSDSQIIQGFKVMKIFRPLKFISINRNIRTVVKSLLKSAYAIANVFFLILVIWLVFGILGIILFRNRFGYCESKTNFGLNRQNCEMQNRTWTVDVNNFNNIFNSSLTLFVVGTLDGWSSIMYTAVNSDIESKGPTKGNNEYSAYIYFLSFIFFGQLFLVNLFIGVIFYEFSRVTQRSKHRFLDQSQIWWVKLQKKIVAATADFKYYKPPEGRFRYLLFRFFNRFYFKLIIEMAVVADILILSIFFDNSNQGFRETLEIVHAGLNLVLLMETVLKWGTLGSRNYFHHFWHKIEFAISCTIVVDLGMFFYYDTIFISIKYVSRVIKAFRAFKMIRFVRIIYSISVVQHLLQTLKFSIPMVLNISSLLMLIYYIYVLLGCHYFRNITNGQIIDDYINFKNFSYSLMTLFKVSTADSWENIMFDVMQEHRWASIYFISFYFLTTDLLTNLFILTLITQFEESNQNSDNPLYCFQDNLNRFRKVWSRISKDPSGLFIKRRDLPRFLKELGLPLGNHANEHSHVLLFLRIVFLKHIRDQKGLIFFNDALFSSMKRVYYSKGSNNPTDFARRKIEQTERKTLMKIEMKKRQNRADHSRLKPIAVQSQPLNPLSNFLYSRLSFNLWRKYTEKTFSKLEKGDEFFESSSENSRNDEYSMDSLSNSQSSSEGSQTQIKIFVTGNETPKERNKTPCVDFAKPQENASIFKLSQEFYVLPNRVWEDG